VTTGTTVLSVRDLTRAYPSGRRVRTVLKGITYTFDAGVFYTVRGPSGSGKTTMLSLAAGLDEPTSGDVQFRGTNIAEIGLSRYRNRHAATIFQSFNLLPYLNAVHNITAAMEITRAPRPHRRRAMHLLDDLGVPDEDRRRRVTELSGGQQQRVAIARALACDIDILFADEPTGNLDHDNATEIVRIFASLAREHGTCVIVATHSQQVADASDVRLELHKGRLVATS